MFCRFMQRKFYLVQIIWSYIAIIFLVVYNLFFQGDYDNVFSLLIGINLYVQRGWDDGF